jgi:glycosyltransferase involved in cell wall biosynthesis
MSLGGEHRSDAPRISVVVPTFNRPEHLRRCLAALAAQAMDAGHYEVIVADDAQQPTIEELVENEARAADRDFRYLAVRSPHGPAAARNVGWRAARGEVIAFTDDDCVADPLWLPAVERAFSAPIAAAWGQIHMPLPPDPTDYERDATGLCRAGFVTANCFCRRQVLEDVGGFDERFRVAWREDSDLHFTLLEQGLDVVYVADALVVHPVRPGRWGVSLAQQRKTRFNALLRRKHPRLYESMIDPFPRSYYAVVGSALATAALVAAGFWPAAAAAAMLWCVLTLRFCFRRLHSTSRRLTHVAEMLLTSVLIPFLSLYWDAVGRWTYRGIKRRPDWVSNLPPSEA